MGAAPANEHAGGRDCILKDNGICSKQKEENNGAIEGREMQSSDEEESKTNKVTPAVNPRQIGATQDNDGFQIQQQKQGTAICWERFLPVRSLNVLLVENDDSTRQVVSALLRNCSYEVVAVGNGLEAWKTLEDADNQIDLVLTEVVMPVLSGTGLLCKIMNHKTFKNIPVIMMSSHDSMGTVFKCLSKGAVDFLVKPIRKNELKNLWQHVWRRCHSSSGSGSESGTQTKKDVKSRTNDECENNTGSSDEHDSGINGLSIRDGSDNGSGTQSSWTKGAAEDDCPHPASPQIQLADARDSTCAQVMQTRPEKYSSVKQYSDGRLDNVRTCKELETVVWRNPHLELDSQDEELSTHSTAKRQNKYSGIISKPSSSGELEHNGENATSKSRNRICEIAGAIADCNNPQSESRHFETTKVPLDITKAKTSLDSGGLTSLELSLKGLRGVVDGGSNGNEERNVLRHSGLSAFSKYTSSFSANQAPAVHAVSCSLLDNSSVAPNTEHRHNVRSLINSTTPAQQINKSVNNDMLSTSNYAMPKPEAFVDKPESTSAFKPFHSSVFQPGKSGSISSVQQVLPAKADEPRHNVAQLHLNDAQQQFEVQHGNQYRCNHVYNQQQQQQQREPVLEKNDLSLNDMATTDRQCGSSYEFGANTESNVMNYSVNGSATGSNHLSSGQNGSSSGANAVATNFESDNGLGGSSSAAGVSQENCGPGADKVRVAYREAALNKFRQKRKERCFEKRVRYHSRKKLAEQRPRIRGQFVRQKLPKGKEGDHLSENVASGDSSCSGVR